MIDSFLSSGNSSLFQTEIISLWISQQMVLPPALISSAGSMYFLSPQKRSITDLQSHWYYTCHLFVKRFSKFPIWSMYLPIMLNICYHLRYLHIYAVSGAGSTPFSRVVMVLFYALMVTAGIETETFWMPIFGNIQFLDFVKQLMFKNTKTEHNVSETSLVSDLRKRGPFDRTTPTQMEHQGLKI